MGSPIVGAKSFNSTGLVATAVLLLAACQDSSDPEPAVCSNPDTELVGLHTESLTLEAACSPYHLAVDGGAFGAVFEGPEVVLTIEAGVEILADAGARLQVLSGAQLVAGRADGAWVTFDSAPGAIEPWGGINLGDLGTAPPVVHELHRVIIRGAAGLGVEEGNAALVLSDLGLMPRLGALLDQVTIERPLDVGLRVHREGNYLAPGSVGLVVEDAGGYPLIMDAQNLATLPANQSLSSLDPARQRILIYGGNEGLVNSVDSDVVWQSQSVPIEVGVSLSVGSDSRLGSLMLPSAQTFLLRRAVGIRMDHGWLSAVGTDTGCKDDGDCSIVFDWATEGELWASLIFVTGSDDTTASQSIVDYVRFAHGGDNLPMVSVVGPGGGGILGDCTGTATVEGCYFEGSTGSTCLDANDSTNEYETLNGFADCSPTVLCD